MLNLEGVFKQKINDTNILCFPRSPLNWDGMVPLQSVGRLELQLRLGEMKEPCGNLVFYSHNLT